MLLLLNWFEVHAGFMGHGGKCCFSKGAGVRWVEVMHPEVDVVPLNLLVVLLYLPGYIEQESDAKGKALGSELLVATQHPLVKLSTTFFCDAFGIVCGNNKWVQTDCGATIDALHGLVNVMCMQLCFLVDDVLCGDWECSIHVDVAYIPIRKLCRSNILVVNHGLVNR